MSEQFFTFTIERFHSLGQEKSSTPTGLVWTPIWRTCGHGKGTYIHMLMYKFCPRRHLCHAEDFAELLKLLTWSFA